MPEYFRIKVGDNGKTFVVDEEGNRIPPERHREIAAKITETLDEDAYVYVGYSPTKMLYKIGKTNNIDRREKELGIEIYYYAKCEPWGNHDAFALEKILHRIFTKLGQQIEGEWFELDTIDLFALAYVIEDDSRTISEIFRIFIELEELIDTSNLSSIIAPYRFLNGVYDFDWGNKLGGLFAVKKLAADYMTSAEGAWMGLLFYEIVLKNGFKQVAKRVFITPQALAEGLLENEIDSLVEDFQRLGFSFPKEKGAE
jgi:hypothetical protein